MVTAPPAGIVVRGHRVASGACGDARFPDGTIAPQLPFFRSAIAGFDAALGGAPYPGTVNLRFAGCRISICAPRHRVHGVAWTPLFAPEDFWLSPCRIMVGHAIHPAFVYIPDPATKPDHAQDAGIVELLARFIPALGYGTRVVLLDTEDALAIVPSAPPLPSVR